MYLVCEVYTFVRSLTISHIVIVKCMCQALGQIVTCSTVNTIVKP